MKSSSKINPKLSIDGLSHVTILGFISNLIEGLAFAQLLQLPYLNYFSSLFVGSTSVAMVALYLLIYRMGRLSISLFDSKLPKFLQRNGFTVGLGIIGCGLFLISMSLQINTNLIFLSALLFGIGTTLSGLNLRELLTSDNDLKKKRFFNILSNIGWSIGVGVSGFILKPLAFKIELYIGLFIILFPFLISIRNSTIQSVATVDETPNKTSELAKLKFASKDLLFVFAVFALMNGLISNQINSSIMNQITNVFGIRDGHQSLVLLLPIFGSFLSLLPAVNKVFKRFSTFVGIFGMNLAYFGILLVLTTTNHLTVYCFFLALVGLFSNEILTAIFQVIATKQEPLLRRGTHALIETVTVVGSVLAWVFNKFYFIDVHLNLAAIFVIPCLLLLFVSDIKSFFVEGGSYDQSHKY